MDVIIDDDYVKQMGQFLKTEAEDMEQKLNQYITILQGICEEGITEGETAKSLAEFTAQMKGLRGIGEVGVKVENFCDTFLRHIDDADGDLY